MDRSAFEVGRNVWKKAKAARVSVLIDADAFYSAFVQAALLARDSIFIIGWDTDSRTELPQPAGIPDSELQGFLSPDGKLELGSFLAGLTKRRPALRIYVLTWDFAFIYLFEREVFPSFKFGALEAEGIRFVLDREHPPFASHHQKIVVIDDAVGFSGGLDMTQRRWDTPEHKGHDPRRTDPGGNIYGPFHDVQICVDGEAAKALGEIARGRWRTATGDEIPWSETIQDIWPQSVAVGMRNVHVGVARTLPSGCASQTTSVREVETLFLDSIRLAREHIYIENQYFTSVAVAEALAERLKEPQGPEIILILPHDQTGWIEESTMGVLRASALKILRDADRFRRLRCYYPIVPGGPVADVKIHSKVMIIDDDFVRVGSANLNGRSMGLDTECDLAIEAEGREDVKDEIRQLRASLLGEHLGVNQEEFAQTYAQTSSLIASVEHFLGSPRTLVPIESNLPEWTQHFTPPREWIDPGRPNGIRRWLARKYLRNPVLVTSLLCLILGFFGAALWFLSAHALGAEAGELPRAVLSWFRSINAEKISSWVEGVKGEFWTIPLILIGVSVLSLILIPITIMIVGLALSFDPWPALLLTTSAALLASLVGYGLGRYWAFSKSRYLAKPWVKRAAETLKQGGVWTIAAVRLTPIAPFTIVNVVAGGLRIPILNFVAGTLLGLLPGIIAITFVSQSAGQLLRGGGGDFLITVVTVIAIVIAIFKTFRSRPRAMPRFFFFQLILFMGSLGLTAEGKTGSLPTSRPGFRSSPEASRFVDVCPRLKMENRGEFTFTAMETRLLCGDPERDVIGVPWSHIPGNQAAYFLRGFLQTRGYHSPEFILDNEILFVRPGPSSRLTRFRIIEIPEGWDPPKRRLIDGSLLTPSLLDDLQAWSVTQIKNDGYPCASATIRADPNTGEALVRLAPGEQKRFVRLESTGEPGLYESALDRYNAFRIGDLYKEQLVELTRRRTLSDGFLQSITMTTRCEPEGAVVSRDVILGPSRLARIGIGGSTELGARVRSILRQNRIGASGSSADLTINASYARKEFNRQSIEGRFRWFYSPGEPRNFLEPRISSIHEATLPAFETVVTTGRLMHGWNREYPRGQLEFQAGPVYLDSLTLAGFAPGRRVIQYADARLIWTNHDFEYFNASPREGERVEVNALMTAKGFGADFTVQRFQFTGQKLWSIFRYDPPFFVLGTRYNVASVFSGDPNVAANLPPEFLTFIGGERDLRGFEPRSLPRNQLPALSAATGSIEGRFHRALFRRVDIFGFVDVGVLGLANMKLQDPIFMSPGFGLRWESPLGVLRSYLARRFAVRELDGEEPYEPAWRIGITFGEEF